MLWRIFALGGYKIRRTAWGRCKVPLRGFCNHNYIMSVASTHREIVRSLSWSSTAENLGTGAVLLATKLSGGMIPWRNWRYVVKKTIGNRFILHTDTHCTAGRQDLEQTPSLQSTFRQIVPCITSTVCRRGSFGRNREWSRRIGPDNLFLVLEQNWSKMYIILHQIHLHLPRDGNLRLSTYEVRAVVFGHIKDVDFVCIWPRPRLFQCATKVSCKWRLPVLQCCHVWDLQSFWRSRGKLCIRM